MDYQDDELIKTKGVLYWQALIMLLAVWSKPLTLV